MRKIITVVEYLLDFLEVNQWVQIIDYDSELVYRTCQVKDILNDPLYEHLNRRIKLITNYHSLDHPDGIALFI